ncbi:CAP domain-containing protein [Bradyrhizobium sp.]|uniref:CAP domain-containing protein n=1 Tax=Bradyrhizobium sp. TaxID=376 RepID=UPI00239B779B|nr:CAP domain-containing protein [Bradyrhizobium sp.]MDE2379496.1 CAP domain-containing protein [Bradyrhizobium sp.]
MRAVLLRLVTPLLAFGIVLVHASAALAADYAGPISAYRRAHGLPAVKGDARLNAVALTQAKAMAASDKVSHFVAGSFVTRVAILRKSRAAENIGAGFLTFGEMLKQWEASRGHRENLLMLGARRVGVAFVDNPKSPYRKFWAMVITD